MGPAGTLASRASNALTTLRTFVSENAPLPLAVVGLFLYGVVWTAYSVFYRAFGLTPRDVGIEYAEIVQEEAVAVVVYAVIVVIVVAGHYLILRALRVRLPRSYKLAAVAVGAVAAVLYPTADAYFSAKHAKRGDGLQVGGGWLPLPLSAPLVYARFADRTVPRVSPITPTDCVLYLGATTETTVLRVLESDRGTGRVVRVPRRTVLVIDSRSRGCERQRCERQR